MADSPLLTKSKAFALEIIRICNEIKRSQKESILTNQLVRSGTSIGANIREAFYAHGKADFIAKLQIALPIHFDHFPVKKVNAFWCRPFLFGSSGRSRANPSSPSPSF